MPVALTVRQGAWEADRVALRALEACEMQVALVGEDLHLIDHSAAFEIHLRDVLYAPNGRVTFVSPLTQGAVLDLLARAMREPADGTWIALVVLQPRLEKLPLLIKVMAARRRVDRAVLIAVVDPMQERVVPPSLLRSEFGLTAAETEVAERLLNGDSLQEICERTGVCISTVRTQLAGVLSKTGSSRQAKLVSLLSRLSMPIAYAIMALWAAVDDSFLPSFLIDNLA